MSLLIDTLLKDKLISPEQLNDAKDKRLGAKKPLQELFVEMGFLTEEDLMKTASKVFKMPILSLETEVIDPALTKIIPYEFAKRYGVFPIRKESDSLVVAMSDIQDIVALDDLRSITNIKIKPILSKKSEIHNFIEKFYVSDESLYDILKNADSIVSFEVFNDVDDGSVLLSQSALKEAESPIVKLANMIIYDSIKSRASDIHIEPQEKVTKVRYRVDGDLRAIMDIPSKLHSALISRIKVVARLDIAETRKPQDGRIKINILNRKIDLRISSIPTFFGEKLEVRILDPKEAIADINRIGFEDHELGVYKEAVNKPQGIILVTGPTGSGKTTTLYATLNFIKSENKNIVTIEDPVEYLIEGVSQIQVNPAKDVTFASGLRSILRQDPNIILVGEIRDKDTSEIAFRASLTGHLVLSTLHTNNAVSSITRLLDLGLESYLIGSSLSLVLAQRLVRLVCPDCRKEYTPDKKLLENYQLYIEELKINKFFKGQGCKTCGYSGYFGRAAIFEVLNITENIKSLISNKEPEDKIVQEARISGFKPIVYAGLSKVSKGLTTLEEVSRVSVISEQDIVVKRSAVSGEKITILLADDEEDIIRTLQKRLESAGYDCLLSRDGLELIEKAHTYKPNLIISDVTMPKMNGFEAVKELRSRLETSSIPIILLTARQDKESELKGIEAGADDYLNKPFDSDKLLARVKMLLRRSSK